MAPEHEHKAAAHGRRDAGAPDTLEHMRSALAAAHMGVFDWDVNSDALTWSSTTGLGLNLEEAPASGRAFFEFVHPDDREALAETSEHAMRDGTDVVTEFRTIASDGVVHWVQAYGRIVYDAEGRPLRILGVNNDITGRKSLEEQLREARGHVERLLVLKSTMRTVQDIVGNAMMGLHSFRMDAEPHVSPESLELFDRIIAETAAKLTAIADLERVVETQMATGTGIDYRAGTPSKLNEGHTKRRHDPR